MHMHVLLRNAASMERSRGFSKPLVLPFVVLQASEDMLVHLLEDCNLCAIHARRITISELNLGGAALPGCCTGLPTTVAAVCDGRLTLRGGSTLPGRSPPCPAVPKDMQLARRIRGPIYGISSM
jgi:hypothetical protein